MLRQDSAWERAHQAGARVFFEPATDTLRTQPENYLIAIRRDEGWHFDLDAALLSIRKSELNKILTEAVRIAESLR